MTTHAESTLRAAGLRVTAPRLATMSVVEERPHSTADVIAAEVRNRLGTVSKQAIYDVLNALTDAGLLRRVAVDGRGAHYELEVGDNHHHIVCTRCGALVDVPCPQGVAPCMEPPVTDHGFEISLAEVVFRGICPNCKEQSEALQAAQPTTGD